jgi:hypothetical protein
MSGPEISVGFFATVSSSKSARRKALEDEAIKGVVSTVRRFVSSIERDIACSRTTGVLLLSSSGFVIS